MAARITRRAILAAVCFFVKGRPVTNCCGWVCLVLLLGVMASSGCASHTNPVHQPARGDAAAPAQSKPAPAAALLNDLCPITTDAVDPTKVATWRGVTIGFCCDSCLREFREVDDKGKDEILAKVRSGK